METLEGTTVETSQVLFSGVITIVAYAVIMSGVYKLFQIATMLGEIKDVLQDIKRHTSDTVAPTQVSATDALLRAVHGDAYSPASAVHPSIAESQR